ncbi:pilus assembly PilX family protein [Variovorax sp. PvP013]|jgi:type IV pilus assembly protein PilX|uniref:pilus assembly PilX family protein n=1 Tax=Variovorax sp. PvP013 TaxID=3156435 RepID=UPI003D2348CE
MRRARIPTAPAQRGLSLIVVLQLLLLVSILGIGAAQIATMNERGARNDRDAQSALQAADAGLADAIRDIDGPAGAVARADAFADGAGIDFVEGCGTGPRNRGLCVQKLAGKPVWQDVDFTDTTRTAGFGDFTGRTFASGAGVEQGVRPAMAPRYVVEAVDDRELLGDLSGPAPKVYRITAMGFGPRRDIQAVVQALYRRKKD